MKKFLSSLLALTMILSLVIVPANASDDTAGYSLKGDVIICEGPYQRAPSLITLNKDDTSNKTVTLVATDGNLILYDNVNHKNVRYDENQYGKTVYQWSITGDTSAIQSDINTRYSESGVLSVSENTLTALQKGTVHISCTVTLKATVGGTSVQASKQSSNPVTITVIDPQTAFEAAAKNATVSFQGRTYSFNNSTSVRIDTFNDELLGDSLPVTVSSAYPNAVLKKDADGQWTIKDSNDGTQSLNVTVTENRISAEAAAAALTFDKASPISIREGQSVDVTAAYNRDGSKNVSYKWTRTPTTAGLNNDNRATVTFNAPDQVSSAGETYTLTCTAKEGTSEVARKNITINVARDPYSPDRNGESSSKTIATNSSTNSCTFKAPILYSSTAATKSIGFGDDGFKVDWAVKSGSTLINKPDQNRYTGAATVTAKSGAKSGTATVTATITYMGKQYPALEYTIDISALDAELSAITNGDNDSYRQSTLEEKLATAINKVTDTTFTSNDINKVQVAAVPSHATLKYNSSKLTAGDEVSKGLDIYADSGYIGDDSFQLKVNGTYIVTLYFKIEGDKDIKDTVTGSASGKDVTFTNSDYDYLFVYKGSSSFKSSMYDGDWSKTSGHSDWTPVKKNSDYTVKSSAFDKNGKATLYVVVVDDDIASTGTIEVSQKSYDITYSVVAGKSVTFSQKDFEAFMKDYAQDNGDWTTSSRKDYPYVDFDHVELNSIPNSKNEGTLYYKNSEVTSSSNRKAEYTDMDKMTFEAVAKPSKDTVTLRFTVVGKQYSSERDKGSKVSYPVDVVISVVKEDIVYTVGIDDTVNLKASDFVSFLQDAKSSYRKAELDYVQFDVKNASNYLYGGLYRSYTNYSSGKLAENSDKFYYEPSRNQLDLSDVAYHTTRWADAGKTVYIPFTVYGTKNEEATGTMAITIAQTMNFTDVKSSDFFYEPVRWAVNQGITNGTSATTFSPYKACTRAEIVTFLWRAAGSPEPTRSTNPFTDVNAVTHSAYYKAILWASQKGITSGTSATTFAPNQLCTRSQIVTFLYRYAGKPSSNYTNPFKDVSATNEASYYNAILWAVGKGITTGTSATTFAPYASCTRGEAVTFLYRYVNGVK